MAKMNFGHYILFTFTKITEIGNGIVDFLRIKRVPGLFALTLFYVFLFHFNQLISKFSSFSSHLMVGIKRDIGLVFLR